MTKISVLGLGNFGTALARNWTVHGKNVCGWTVENDVFESIKATGVNEKYLPSFDLPGMGITMELDTALDRADIVALALPSHVVLDVVDAIMPLLTDSQVLLDLAKGLAPGEELVSNAIGQKLMANGRGNSLAVMAPDGCCGSSRTCNVRSCQVTANAVHRVLMVVATVKSARQKSEGWMARWKNWSIAMKPVLSLVKR